MAAIVQKIVDIFHFNKSQKIQVEHRISIDGTIDEQWLLSASDEQIDFIDKALQDDPYYTEIPREEVYPVTINELPFMIETMKSHGYTLDDYVYLTQDTTDPLEADAMIRVYKDYLEENEEHLSPRQYYDYFKENQLDINYEFYKSVNKQFQGEDEDEITAEMFNAIIEKHLENFQMFPDDSIFTKIEDVATEHYKEKINDDGELVVPFDENDNFGMIISEFPEGQEAGIITMVIFDPVTAQDHEHFSSGFVIDYSSNTVIWENVGIPMLLYHHETVEDTPSIGMTVRIINQKETIEKIGFGGITITSPRHYFGAWHYYEGVFEGATDQETFDAITIDPYTGEVMPPEEGLDVISTHNFEYREKML